ncbi:hypothetical protein [Streptomyces chartreusis]|uniref:Uncharacterized protein n=1 Tax=Streptomyces chartreusis TaxID=1969 RepID=A0A7I0NSW6_STRCX|nr:hypothetical protein [Streptomyces chartreusis]QKZ16159.1 hypothetical protein HUT05_01455 [Streptomyces chartreusis]QKZ23924.1 hypothetical protein HUT05_45175 [Streptomyces chartreusis]
MDSESVVAACAVVIAVASLAVSVYEARATRQHNRHSVRPILQLQRGMSKGQKAGIKLINSGLGPAVVVSSTLTVDGHVIGAWNKAGADRARAGLVVRPYAVTFTETHTIATGYEGFLLSVDPYEPDAHAEFLDLMTRRLQLEIRYESLYGGENYRVTLRPRIEGES